MFLIPLIRSTRAISASLIYPEHPVHAIAISEIVSVIGPILNPQLLPKILGTMYAIILNPTFAYYYLQKYNDINNMHNQAEICTGLLFIAIMVTYYYI
tara:strand:- start:10486 stop:10779 length:294 start_codon:yes stop_codon:yes gene_type:complete